MNKPTNKMSNEDKQALKKNHRLELVMQEMGERFEDDKKRPEIWRSITTPGLTVNIKKQVFDIDEKSGDVFTWLMHHFSWTFPQAIRYLQKRPADTLQVVKPIDQNAGKPYALKRYESGERDLEKESSGLYEHVRTGTAKGILHIYLPKPLDRYQEKALEVHGEKIRDYFSWKWESLVTLRDFEYHRFTPVQDLSISFCEECDSEIAWHFKQKPQYQMIKSTDGNSFQRVRIYPPEVFAYIVMDGEDEIFICADCKRKHEGFYYALDLLIKSAWQRESPAREKAWQEHLESERQSYLQAQAKERDDEDRLNRLLALQAEEAA